MKGIKRYTLKGVEYCYHRATGTRIEAPFGSPAFADELRVVEAKIAGLPAAIDGTLDAAVLLYKVSYRWTQLAPRTKSDYDKILTYLAPLGRMPLATIDRAFIAGLRDKTFTKKKRAFANMVVLVLSVVFSVAAENGLIADNPAKGVRLIPRPKGSRKVNRAWLSHEREAVMAAASPELRLPIALGMFAGLREGDVLALPRNAVKDGWLVVQTAKRDVGVSWPLHSELARIIAESGEAERRRREKRGGNAPIAMTLCVTSRGTPWTGDGFRSSFFKLIRQLKAAEAIGGGITFHGLRHTVGALLKEDGASDEDIAIALGHKTVTMARKYSEEASRRTRMTAATMAFDPLKRRK